MRHPALIHPTSLGDTLTLEIGFDLIYRLDNLVIGNQIKQPIRLEIGNTDCAGFAFCVKYFI